MCYIIPPITMATSLRPIIPQLENLYACYNKREYVNPDPLQFLYDYPNIRDREIVGIIASVLAYGGVKQILGSIGNVLNRMDPLPYKFLISVDLSDLKETLKGFKHRFATSDDLAQMLWGVKRMIEDYGSLQKGFLTGFEDSAETVLSALIRFVEKLKNFSGIPEGNETHGLKHLLASPEKGGASKRLNLFLRWMVRKDAVDPGGWNGMRASKLIVPIDLHMHRIGLALGITKRKQADLKAALEITAAFREIVPEDPVKYDFVLTRLGIRDDTDMDGFLRACRLPEVARGDS